MINITKSLYFAVLLLAMTLCACLLLIDIGHPIISIFLVGISGFIAGLINMTDM